MSVMIVDIAGTRLTPEDIELLKHPLVGGVIFFTRNFECPEQMIQLVQSIKALRHDLLLTVDQEGGRVQRFKAPLTRLPHLQGVAQYLKQTHTDLEGELTEVICLAQLMALEIRALGIDLSFAPVLDLNKNISQVIGNRSFDRDPHVVGQLAKAYVKGMHRCGMKATGKHFPGHGAVELDSHQDLPIDSRSFEAVQEDLLPFKILIKSGIDAIMPAHIIFDRMDEFPVGFSTYWLQTVLRRKLGFKGAIVSDDLSMQGAAQFVSDPPQRVHAALKAGCDLVNLCNDRSAVIQVCDQLHYTPSNESLARIGRLKANGPCVPFDQLPHDVNWQHCQKRLTDMMGIQ